MAKRSSFLYSPVTLTLIFFVVMALALGVSRITKTHADDENTHRLLNVQTLSSQDVYPPVEGERYIGRVEAGQRVEVGFDISSKVVDIKKREGERFAKGELLASLNTERLLARKAELKAQLARSAANLALAKSSLRRAEGLKKSGNISDQALDEARQRRASAEADYAVVEAQLDTIGVELNKSHLYAPFDGVVIDRLSDEGRTVVAGVPVLLLEQTGKPEIKVSLPLNKARDLTPGDRVSVFHHDQEFQARVDRINLSLTAQRVSELYVHMEEVKELIPGEILYVELVQMKGSTGIWLPTTALTEFGRGLWSVYLAVPDANNPAKASIERTVVELDMIRGDKALVSAGLSREQVPYVVSAATHRVVAGQHVLLSPDTQISQRP